MHIFGVHLLGMNSTVGMKALLTVALLVVLSLLRALLGAGLRRRGAIDAETADRRFWTVQIAGLAFLVVLVAGAAAIWFDDPSRFATVAGLLTAGLAVALQRVITSFAAYVIILRSRVFAIGDRVTFGGVRGDVVALGFMQTTVMEMGQPPSVQDQADPAVWVRARQYTGRIVRITNDKIFDSPVYNYTREFPFLWEEITIPIKYDADRARMEQILLDATTKHTRELVAEAAEGVAHLRTRYFLPSEATLEPRVYLRLTDNWIELTVRFLTRERAVRPLKDAISRDVLSAMEAAGLGVASGTYAIVELPPVDVRIQQR